jgi:hypothetical protein
VGVAGKIRCDRAWHTVCTKINVLMAQVDKRHHGTHHVSLGVGFIDSLGLAYITQDKLGRCITRLSQIKSGTLTYESLRSLLGLLEHVLFLADMDAAATAGMYVPLNQLRSGEAKLSDTLDPASLTEIFHIAVAAWQARFATTSAAAYTAAVPALARAQEAALLGAVAVATRYWQSDAAKEGTPTPGVGGCDGGCNWVRPLTIAGSCSYPSQCWRRSATPATGSRSARARLHQRRWLQSSTRWLSRATWFRASPRRS